MPKLMIFSLCVLFVLAGSAGAQDKDSSKAGNRITTAVILEKNLRATGGLEAFQRLQSMVVRGELGLSRSRTGEFSFFYQLLRATWCSCESMASVHSGQEITRARRSAGARRKGLT
jgi:hypothetical protein